MIPSENDNLSPANDTKVAEFRRPGDPNKILTPADLMPLIDVVRQGHILQVNELDIKTSQTTGRTGTLVFDDTDKTLKVLDDSRRRIVICSRQWELTDTSYLEMLKALRQLEVEAKTRIEQEREAFRRAVKPVSEAIGPIPARDGGKEQKSEKPRGLIEAYLLKPLSTMMQSDSSIELFAMPVDPSVPMTGSGQLRIGQSQTLQIETGPKQWEALEFLSGKFQLTEKSRTVFMEHQRRAEAARKEAARAHPMFDSMASSSRPAPASRQTDDAERAKKPQQKDKPR